MNLIVVGNSLVEVSRVEECVTALRGIPNPQAFMGAVKKYMAHDSTVGDMDEAHAALAALMAEAME